MTKRLCHIILLALFQLMALNSFAQPKADFTLSSVSGCSPLTETFTDATTGGTGPYSYLWRLGNSNASYTKNPSAIYYKPGIYNIMLKVSDAKNNQDSIIKTITVFQNPVAAFSAITRLGCIPFNASFLDQSSSGSSAISKWLWDFGDGNTSQDEDPGYHTYSAPGKYNVSLVVTDGNGCTGSVNVPDYITVANPPAVNFIGSPTSSCTSTLTVNFSSTVNSSSRVNYLWQFGDGTISTIANPTKTYSAKGVYTVKLLVTDSLGCRSSEILPDYIAVGHLNGAFNTSTPGGCAPLSVKFIDASIGLPTGSTFSWDFGDGSSSTSENPTHIYAVGTYTVSLIVASPGGGCFDTVVKQKIINASGPFQPSFSADSVVCQYPYSDVFTNTSGPNTKVISWHFGDSIKPYYEAGDPVLHSFPDSGAFSITLKVEDKNGCVESVTKNNFVRVGPTAAAIGIDSVKGCVPLTIHFSNLSYSKIDSIVSYYWDFGDGTTSNAFSPGKHTYRDTGQYKLALEVRTAKGCSAVDTVKIKVAGKPIVKFSFSPDSGCLSMLRNIKFVYQAFGVYPLKDDSLALTISPNPKHFGNPEFKPGSYVYTLVAYADSACPDSPYTYPHPLIVTPPWANYFPYNDTCSLQNHVSFTDNSIGASRVEYYFGDGDSSSLRNPSHIYKDTGYYYPYEVVYDSANGCSDVFSFYSNFGLHGLYIKEPWFIAIQPLSKTSATSGCVPFTLKLKLYDSDTSDNLVFFGDGTSEDEVALGVTGGPEKILTHVYTTPGVYKINMVSTNNRGCKQAFNMSQQIVVAEINQSFSVSPVKGCAPLTVTLIDSVSSDYPIVKNEFDMGNGDIVKATSHKMTYTYTKAPPDQAKGFQINYIVSNGYCTDTISRTVYPQQPIGQIFPFGLSTCDSVAYQFVPKATGLAPFKYLWIFGKNDTTSNSQPIHIFPIGNYDVQLKVTDSAGCIDTAHYPVQVYNTKDSAGFDIVLSKKHCPPVTANFINKSKYQSLVTHECLWDFGDGSSSTEENPSKIYNKAGTFTVTLKITNGFGCTSKMTKTNVIVINGASGTYSFVPKAGCNPLNVQFKAISGNATKFEWDFGDGTIGYLDTITHVYKNPGSYVPLLLLQDSSGCLYTLPPIDTITVYTPPSVDFGNNSTCPGQPMNFTDKSTTSYGDIVAWQWDFGDGGSTPQQNPSHIFNKNGFYPVKLTVTTNKGCTNSIQKLVKYGDIIAQFKASKTGCLGNPTYFKDMTISDSSIKSWFWLFGDGSSSTAQNPTHTYLSGGVFPVSLYVSDYKGCTDSLKNGAHIIIGDTIPPKTPEIYRVTVVDDHNVEIDFRKNTDYDFEKYLVYDRDESGNVKLIDSVLDPGDTIRMEHGLNNLHHSYCFLVQAVNVCGYRSDTSGSLYHCTINLDAKPGINEAQLSWTPYYGWDVAQYKILRQGAESPPVFAIIDSVPGSQLKYIDTNVVCYRPMVYKVEGIEKAGNRMVSFSDTAATVPNHVAHVPPAQMVRATVENNKNTVVEWTPVAKGHVKNWILEKSEDGVNFQLIDTPITANIDSEADQQVDVQKTSYTYRLRILDSCGDLGPYSDIGKTILLNADTNADVKPYLVWTGYRDWPEGVQYYDIDIENPKNGFDWLARTGSGKDTAFVDNITDLNSLPFYTYHVVAHRNGTLSNPDANVKITSMSNDATLKPHSRLFIPNAFTPNGDGLNDSFFVQGLYIKEFHIKIFDRWGTKVFESGSMKDKWSGSFRDGPPILDSYKYLIYYRGVDNVDRYTVGWVTLLM